MTAWTSEEEERRRRRKRILKGLLIGGAAVGVPVLINAAIARKARRVEPATWGRRHRYAWDLADVVFQRIGAGDAIVLLHSFGPGHDGLEWRGVAELLARDFQVFVPDLPGWGRSARPSESLDGELYIDFLIDFLNDVVRRRALLVAAGLPAAYAIQLAVDHPELVRGLALCCPIGIDQAGEEPDLKDAIIHRLLRLPVFGTSALNVYTSRRGIEHHLREEVFADPALATEALVDHHYRGAHDPSNRSALAAYLAGYLNHRVAHLLPRIGVPALLVWGRRAVSPPVESADLWLAALPDGEIEVLEGAGAAPHAEGAGETAERLALFARRLPTA